MFQLRVVKALAALALGVSLLLPAPALADGHRAGDREPTQGDQAAPAPVPGRTFGYRAGTSFQWGIACLTDAQGLPRFRVTYASVRYYALDASPRDAHNFVNGVKLKYRVVPHGQDTTFSWDHNWSPQAEVTWPGGTFKRGRITAKAHGQTQDALADGWDIEIRVQFMKPGKDWVRKQKIGPINVSQCAPSAGGGGLPWDRGGR